MPRERIVYAIHCYIWAALTWITKLLFLEIYFEGGGFSQLQRRGWRLKDGWWNVLDVFHDWVLHQTIIRVWSERTFQKGTFFVRVSGDLERVSFNFADFVWVDSGEFPGFAETLCCGEFFFAFAIRILNKVARGPEVAEVVDIACSSLAFASYSFSKSLS